MTGNVLFYLPPSAAMPYSTPSAVLMDPLVGWLLLVGGLAVSGVALLWLADLRATFGTGLQPPRRRPPRRRLRPAPHRA